MDINTHKKIDRNLCGKPLEIDEGFSRVELLLTDNMEDLSLDLHRFME
ncbi:MAG: hypothetical protein Q8N95_05485 [Desulfobacterales bacterium]|nr:hypothetical protein [Desulfobacterales bacterium]